MSKLKRFSLLILLFIFSFFFGEGIAKVQEHFFPESLRALPVNGWGLSFQQEGEPPVADVSSEELAQYNAYYAKETDEKVLYLTFDAGYENGNTKPILEALKKHNAPAAFFAVGTYLENNPDLIKQMVSEGHIVGNHTFHHPDMTQITDTEAFAEELHSVEEVYQEITGKAMKKFFRPPQGTYDITSLSNAQKLGYQTIFWSMAYVDWKQDAQPSREEALDTLLSRTHPGAIVLLHSTSSTNAAIMDELLTKWEEMGYVFRSLEDF